MYMYMYAYIKYQCKKYFKKLFTSAQCPNLVRA